MPKTIKITIPAYTENISGDGVWELSGQCFMCKNFNMKFNKNEEINCLAFKGGISKEILNGEVDHTKPYKGDNGITFEPIEDD